MIYSQWFQKVKDVSVSLTQSSGLKTYPASQQQQTAEATAVNTSDILDSAVKNKKGTKITAMPAKDGRFRDVYIPDDVYRNFLKRHG